MPDAPTKAEVAKAKELLASSQRLRDDLIGAVGKLDSYIEQLRAVVPPVDGGTTTDVSRT